MFREIILPILRSTRLRVTACGMLNTQSSAPENGQNNFPKHVELIGIIDKTVTVASVWLSILFISATNFTFTKLEN
jgi:hypothetical protein